MELNQIPGAFQSRVRLSVIAALLTKKNVNTNTFSPVQSLSHVRLFSTPMDSSMPGLAGHHQLLELTQTHVH